jgi:hypothetical protein
VKLLGKYVSIILLVTMCAGCFQTIPKPHHNYPADIFDMCYAAKYDCKDRIVKINPKFVAKDKRCTVVKRDGERKINGVWAWLDPQWPDYYIGGYCLNGGYIVVGCNPVTKNEISYGVLIHEFGHHWLMGNDGGSKHPLGFESVFGFADRRRIRPGSWVVVSISGVDESGKPYHADVLMGKKELKRMIKKELKD